MDITTKIKREIERLEKLIEDSEAIMEQVPSHLRPYQEMALNLHRESIARLESMLAGNITQARG